MKNVLKAFGSFNRNVLLLVIAFAALQTAVVFGQEGTAGLEYTSISNNNEYSVKAGTATSGRIVIPATHNGRPVREISPGAFKNSNIESITIGNNVTKIHNDAFIDCSQLKTVNLPASLTYIGEHAFENSGLTAIVIPDGVETIAMRAFFGCKNLKTATLGRRVSKLDLSTFEGCIDLETVNIGNGVNSIGPRAFFDCKRLTSVTIGNLVTSIGPNSFDGCISLERITIPANVTSIQSRAFNNCTKLVRVTIQGVIASRNFARNAFPGNLQEMYLINDPRSGGAGTYTRTPGLNNWLKA